MQNPAKKIPIAFINLQKGIDDLQCNIPESWTADKISSFYTKFHQSYIVQNGNYSASLIIGGKKFENKSLQKDFIPFDYTSQRNIPNTEAEVKVFVNLVKSPEKSDIVKEAERTIINNRIFKLLYEYTNYARKCHDTDKLSISEFLSTSFPFMNQSIDKLLSNCEGVKLEKIQPEYLSKEVIEQFKISGRDFISNKRETQSQQIQHRVVDDLGRNPNFINNNVHNVEFANQQPQIQPEQQQGQPLQQNQQPLHLQQDQQPLNLQQNQPELNNRNLQQQDNNGVVNNMGIGADGQNVQEVVNNNNNGVAANNDEGNLDWTTAIWLTMIIAVICLQIYFNKYDQLILLTITIFLRMFENEGVFVARNNDDEAIQALLNNPGGPRFRNRFVGWVLKFFEGFICFFTSMLPGFTIDRYVTLVYHNWFKNFVKCVMCTDEEKNEKDQENKEELKENSEPVKEVNGLEEIRIEKPAEEYLDDEQLIELVMDYNTGGTTPPEIYEEKEQIFQDDSNENLRERIIDLAPK